MKGTQYSFFEIIKAFDINFSASLKYCSFVEKTLGNLNNRIMYQSQSRSCVDPAFYQGPEKSATKPDYYQSPEKTSTRPDFSQGQGKSNQGPAYHQSSENSSTTGPAYYQVPSPQKYYSE